jgi:hypothetical protein
VVVATDRTRNADLIAGHADVCQVVDWTGPWWTDVEADAIVASSSLTSERWLDPATCLPRARWAIDVATRHKPNTVVDVGANDGLVTIPLLKACPSIHLVAVE